MAMSRGPKRKPEPLRELQGYPDHRPKQKVLKTKQVRPPMPKGLSNEAKKEWKRIVDACMRYGLCADIDHAVFRRYIFEWQICEMLTAMVLEHGVMSTTVNGEAKRAPWDTSLVQHTARLQSLLNEIGFTPAARSKVSADEPADAPKDPFAVFEFPKPVK